LFYGKNRAAKDLGERASFADMGQTLADYFDLAAMPYGQSFLAS